MKTEIANIEQMNPATLFKAKPLLKLLEAIEKEVTSEVTDVDTPEGRDAIKSLAYKVARSKTTLDDLGKNFVSDQKAAIAAIDGCRKTARDYLDDLKVRVRKPLTDYEEKEAKRMDKIEDKIREIRRLGELKGADGDPWDADMLKVGLAKLRSMKITKVFEEFQEEANNRKNESIVNLIEAIPKREALEAEFAEAARKAEEQKEADRIQRENDIASQAVKDAENKAQRELDQRDAAEAQEKADQEKREKNTRHKGAINKAAASAIEEIVSRYLGDGGEALEEDWGNPEEMSKAIVKAIVVGNVPSVTINY